MKKSSLVAALQALMPGQERFINSASLPTVANAVAVHLFITYATNSPEAEMLRTFLKSLHEVGWFTFDKEDS